jgi:hypothetical protein
VVLTNYIGLRGQSFVMDKIRESEVWNQPIEGYSIKILNQNRGASEGAAAGTVREVVVEAVVRWVNEVENEWEKSGTNLKVSNYKYRLELDSRGRIIGGAWLSFERPDFIWTQSKPGFTGFMAPLKELYEMSVR